MTKFLFVRHGQAENNLRPHIISGQSNHLPLTSIGREEAALVGAHLRDEGYSPDLIFSSPAVRAKETAHIVLHQLRIEQSEIHFDERLLEMSQGDWEGKDRAAHYTPENKARYELDHHHGKVPGAESMIELQERLISFIEEVAQLQPKGKVLVFTHGLATRALAGFIQQQTKQEILEAKTPNVSLTHFSRKDGVLTVDYVGKNAIGTYT